jgi:signal transduction histidine kinase
MHGRSEAGTREFNFLSGGGEMGALMRAHDWAATPLGVPEAWPRALKTAVRLILNTGHPMYIWWGPDLLCFYNDAYRRTLGPERHPGSLGKPGREVWAEIWHLIGHQVDFVMAGRGSTWDENRPVPITRFGRLDEIYWTYSYSPIDDETAPNGVGGVLVVCTETTQAVLAERRRAAETERQRRLFEQAPGFITILAGPEHVFEFANQAYRRLVGGRDTVGNTVREVLPELEDQGFYELLDRVYATGERFVASSMPIRLQATPGAESTDRFLDFIYEPVRDERGAITGIFVEGYDVTERVRAEASLRGAEERYLALFNAIDQGFCTIEVAFDNRDHPVDYRFLEVSPSFERQTGIENGAGRWMREIAPDQDQHWFDTYGRVALTGEPARFENYSTPLGRWWDVYAFRISGPRRIAVLFRDITDQKRAEAALRELNDTLEQRVAERSAELLKAEAALRQAQKMEAIGQLTGGVAHDFNNLLTIIKSSTDLLRRPDLAEERRWRYVSAISDTVDRASKLTGQLLAFARRQALKPEVFDVPERIKTVVDLLGTVMGSRIQIVTDIADQDCFVEADANQFETALVNMAVNARDAMEDEGTLTIRVEAVEGTPAQWGHAVRTGPFVAISISDTGAGIPADQLSQIFEPFFTTKEVGKGTGLGLSQVYGFVKQSGGDVVVESKPGQGTTFVLYLPQVEPSPKAPAGSAIGEGQAQHGRGRRVLVVEDNREVGEFSTQLLQDLGYETTWAANADEVLMLLRSATFDVVFSDVVMPGMSGVELGKEIRWLYPGLPVVLTSGYSHVLAEDGRHGFELLHKPYAVEDLSRVLRRVTRGRSAP